MGKTTLVNPNLPIARAKKVRSPWCAATGRAARRPSEAAGIKAERFTGG